MAAYLPTNLNIGDTFQIAFLTIDVSSGGFHDIDIYNNFVQQDWSKHAPSGEIREYLDRDGDISFKCICTVSGEAFGVSGVDAKTNVTFSGTGGSNYKGIYRLDGKMVTNKWENLWYSDIYSPCLTNPINIHSDGSPGPPAYPGMGPSGNVWTGSWSSGTFTFPPLWPSTSWPWCAFPLGGMVIDTLTGKAEAFNGQSWDTHFGYDAGGLHELALCNTNQFTNGWLLGPEGQLPGPVNTVHDDLTKSKYFYALSEVLTWAAPPNGCYDCGAVNVLGVRTEYCCPRPENAPTPTPTDCCPYQYKKPGLIVCYKKTKYNTPFFVSGAQGPAKFRLMPHNYTGQKLRQTRNQRGRWNHRLSNTKLFPVISECRDICGNLTSVIQSKNIFINTDYKMPKHELLSYLSRNAKYLHR